MLWLTCNCFDLLNVHHMTADAEWVNCFHPTSAGIFDTLLSIHPLGLVWVQVLASIGVLCGETVMAQLPVMRVWCPILMTWCHLKNWFHWLWNPSKFFYSICTLIVCCFFSRSSIVDHRPFIGITNFALLRASIALQALKTCLLHQNPQGQEFWRPLQGSSRILWLFQPSEVQGVSQDICGPPHGCLQGSLVHPCLDCTLGNCHLLRVYIHHSGNPELFVDFPNLHSVSKANMFQAIVASVDTSFQHLCFQLQLCVEVFHALATTSMSPNPQRWCIHESPVVQQTRSTCQETMAPEL